MTLHPISTVRSLILTVVAVAVIAPAAYAGGTAAATGVGGCFMPGPYVTTPIACPGSTGNHTAAKANQTKAAKRHPKHHVNIPATDCANPYVGLHKTCH